MTRNKYGHLSTPGARGGEHTPHQTTEDESQIYKVTRDHQVGPDGGEEQYKGESGSKDNILARKPLPGINPGV